MSMPGIAVTLNAEPITIVAVQPSRVTAIAAGQRRRRRPTAFDLVTSPVIGRSGLSPTCVIT